MEKSWLRTLTLYKTNNRPQLHYAKQCPATMRSPQYTWHNNSILYTRCHYLSEFENAGFKLYPDLTGFKSPTELFNTLIPDIVLVRNNKLIVIELACCFETNFSNSRKYKINRYENIKKTVRTLKWTVHKTFVKVSFLGFVTKDLNRF